MTTIYRADQVGSLLRPQELLEARKNPGVSRGELTAVEDRCVLDALARQQRAGFRIFTDGELRRSGFMGDFYESVEGLSSDYDLDRTWQGAPAGVAAASGMSGNDMNRDEKIRRLSIRLAGEGVRVGQALGYQLEHIRTHDPETIARAAEGDPAALDEVESQILAGLRSNTRSELARPSMGQDMLKGRRTEIDSINGVIAAKGQEVGVAAPTHVKLVAAVKQVELGKIPARPENLYAI